MQLEVSQLGVGEEPPSASIGVDIDHGAERGRRQVDIAAGTKSPLDRLSYRDHVTSFATEPSKHEATHLRHRTPQGQSRTGERNRKLSAE